MKKKGFTLIELLAVIVVLAIIALIATPIILGVIEKAKYGAFRASIGGVVNAIENSCVVNMTGGKNCGDTFLVNESKQISDVKVKGSLPTIAAAFNEKDKVNVLYAIDEKTGYCAKGVNGQTKYGKMKDNVCVVSDNLDYHHNDTEVGLSGSGTEEDPYQISSIEDLAYYSYNFADYASSYVVLTANLDFNNDDSYINPDAILFDNNLDGTTQSIKEELTVGKGWSPITNSDKRLPSAERVDLPYNINFDGQNHTINNLYINISNNYSGLFGRMYYYTEETMNKISIKNLNLNVEIVSKSSMASALIGYTSAKQEIIVDNVMISGIIDSTSSDNGMIIGQLSSKLSNVKISNVIIDGQITSAGYAGGLVGTIDAGNVEIINAISNVDINAVNSQPYVGGIIGRQQGNGNLKVYNVSNFGNVNGNTYVGGIIGSHSSSEESTFEKIYNFGNINGNTYVGAIVGYESSDASIANVINYGNINGNYAIGGIAGLSFSEKSSKELTNYGKISGRNYIGGLFGYVSSPLSDSTNYGDVEGIDFNGNTNCNYIAGLFSDTYESDIVITNVNNYGNVSSHCTTSNTNVAGISPNETDFILTNVNNYGTVTY